MTFVRSSKYRHIFSDKPKSENCYNSVNINKVPWEGNMSSVNAKFLAVSLEGANGGSFMVVPLEKTGRIDLNHPKVTGHKGPVLDLQFNPFNDNEVVSASDDCEIKLWTIPDGGLTANLDEARATLIGHSKKVERLAWHPSAANILASSSRDKTIKIWNTETAEEKFSLSGFSDNINSFSWNYNGKYIASSCKTVKGSKLQVWNVREESIVQEGMTHQGSKPSHCLFLGSRNQILTTGFTKTSERQYSLWDAGDLSKPLVMEKLDSSSGVLMPFWDEVTSVFYLVGKGDCTIRFFEVTDTKPYVFGLSLVTYSQPARGACTMPQHNLNYLKCEVMRFYRLQQTKKVVEPINMIVPRKSEMLQDDIFNKCLAPIQAHSADDWLGGADKDPRLYTYTRDGLVELPPAECQITTDIKFKGKEAPVEKPQASVLKRYGSPEPSATAVLVTLDDYKRAYTASQAEIEKLKKEVAELKAR